jgi:hypothetical protein
MARKRAKSWQVSHYKVTPEKVAHLEATLRTSGHIGKANRITTEALSKKLELQPMCSGNGRGQELRAWVEEAHAGGIPIVATTGAGGGYYLAESATDLLPTLRRYERMAKQGKRRAAYLRRMIREQGGS